MSGEIIFPNAVSTLPESSCVIIKLKDVSFHDTSSNVLASNIFKVNGKNVQRIEYSLNSKKPLEENLNRVTVVTAVVNVGWCKSENSDDWLREGDYLSVMRHRVILTNDEDTYTHNINVVCYCKYGVPLFIIPCSYCKYSASFRVLIAGIALNSVFLLQV